ncbi:tRNA-dihydrouridine synthase 2 [Rhodotorula kratochvilovae]
MASLTRSRSPPSPSTPTTEEPAAKRIKVADTPQATPTKRRRTLPYARGLHLAPMVRIGTLPVRLLALEYGAELVWGPEIVDKAIIGAERSVDPKTGVVSFSKNGRSIFECHPLEKPRLIFQLGSASPDLAVQALRVIENDVAGVGLNCGCPKAFSLQGGMGAALLKDPERLCSILTALVGATSLPIDAKIRLLPLPTPTDALAAADSSTPAPSGRASPASAAQPTPSAVLEPSLPPTLGVPPSASPSSSSEEADEPTIPLVERILSTGIANLTVHCRTQTMRSSERALHARMRALAALGAQRGVPVVCNGDADGWGNLDEICGKTGVKSAMIARAAEANVSCFRREGLLDPIGEVIPRLLRIAIATNNHYSNTKYILNAMSLFASPSPPSRERNRELKLAMNKARSYEEMGAAFGLGVEEVDEARGAGEAGLAGMLPAWSKRRAEIVAAEGEP